MVLNFIFLLRDTECTLSIKQPHSSCLFRESGRSLRAGSLDWVPRTGEAKKSVGKAPILLASFRLRLPPGRRNPIWNRRECTSGILKLTPKGDHLSVAQAFCDP